jgi:long-chain fatty acid transport protein
VAAARTLFRFDELKVIIMNVTLHRLSAGILLIGTLLFGWTAAVLASGFGIFTQGASATARANAVVASLDGPAAVYFNPALLNDLPGTQVELGTTVIVSQRKFKSSQTGGTAHNEDPPYFPSSFYLTHTFSEQFSAGLGVFNPFGLGTIWDGDWEGRYLATKSRITTFNINPALSWRVTPRLSLAAGLDILLLDAKLQQRRPFLPDLPDIKQQFTGDGEGVGFNTGLLLKITDRLSLGATYRSEIKVDVDGQAKLDLPLGLPPLRVNGQTSLTLPQQVTAGLAYRFNERWTAEAGLRWEGWSSFKQLKIDLDDNSQLIAPRQWRDTLAFNVGARYQWSDRLALMGGYLYGENPVPDRTFEPAVPDSDTHLFCLGAEWRTGATKVALAYGFQYQEDRRKTTNLYGDIANGRYENQLHLVGLSASYQF